MIEETSPKDARRKTPQDKKALSYAKDRRNTYGENPAASRKGIRFRKRQKNKVNRRDDRVALASAAGILNPEVIEHAVEAQSSRRPKAWKKEPDRPLGEVLERKRQWRALRMPDDRD